MGRLFFYNGMMFKLCFVVEIFLVSSFVAGKLDKTNWPTGNSILVLVVFFFYRIFPFIRDVIIIDSLMDNISVIL